MALEPWTITTTYPDGRTEERLATPEEVAQREADIAAFEAEEALRLAEEAAREEARVSARVKLIEQGFTNEEIDVMYPSLVGPEI